MVEAPPTAEDVKSAEIKGEKEREGEKGRGEGKGETEGVWREVQR